MSREVPFLFSAPMVRALLDGRKTQTRRIAVEGKLPAAMVGDTIWGRETFRLPVEFDSLKPTDVVLKDGGPDLPPAPSVLPVFYEADGLFPGPQWGKTRVSIHMPRRASRLSLRVTQVRTVRLQDISEADALAEGVIGYEPTMEDPAEFSAFEGSTIFETAVEAFEDLWRRINGSTGPKSWEANPLVWAYSFEVERGLHPL